MIILPSLEIVPAKYNGNILLSQIPINGSGDFTVTRATVATRVNASGLIESVASGIPRLDYFASGGVVGCPALLVEPSGSNGILNSTDTTTSWVLGANLTSGAIDVIGVTGNELTVALSGSNIGASAGRLRRTSMTIDLASGSTYTISFFLKKTGAHTIGGYYATIGGLLIGSGFDVSGSFSSGVITGFNTALTTNRIRRVEQWGTDVYRCSETFTMTASGTLTNINFAPLSGVTSQSNSAVDTELGFAAPQIELGSVPTSFIPTTTAAVTRNADAISVSGAVSGAIGQTEGTIYAEVDVTNLGFTRSFINVQDSSYASNAVRIESHLNQWRIHIKAASVNVLDEIIASPTISSGIYKIAIAYNNAASGVVFAVNGSIIYTNASALTMPSGMDRVHLGTRLISTSLDLFLNDRIRAAALYTTRLSNTQLALLTSPYTSYSQMASALSYTLG